VAANELYERNYSGDSETVLVQTALIYEGLGGTCAAQGVRPTSGMSEYDVDGWKMPGFFDGDET